MHEYEQEKLMPYATSIERLGREEGRIQTLREVILETLEARFGAMPTPMREAINAEQDMVRLKRFQRLSLTNPNLKALQEEDPN